MRNPSLILAAAMFAAVAASADSGADWRNVRFKDEAGREHSLWCRVSECGPGGRAASALYDFDNGKSATTTTEDGMLWWKKTTSTTNKSFDAKLSTYRLNLAVKPNKAVVGAKSYAVEDQPALPAGVTLKVNTTGRRADDLPTALTDAEKYWLSSMERTGYDGIASDPKNTLDQVRTAQAQARRSVAKHLPLSARAGYQKLTAGAIDPNKVSTTLDGLFAIKDPEELKKLEAITSGKARGTHANALEEYQAQMKAVKLGPDGRPVPEARDQAVKNVASFRDALKAPAKAPSKAPSKTPGKKPDGTPVDPVATQPETKPGTQPETKPGTPATPAGPRRLKLSDEDEQYLSIKDRSQYRSDKSTAEQMPASQERDDKLAEIAAKYQAIVDDIKQMSAPKDVSEFAGWNEHRKGRFCESIPPKGGAANSSDTRALPQLKGWAGSTDNGAGAADGKTSAPAANPKPGQNAPAAPSPELLAKLQESCKQFLDNQTAGNTPGLKTDAVPTPPSKGCDDPKAPAKPGSAAAPAKAGTDKDTTCPPPDGPNPNLWRNLANASGFAVFGLVLGSFFGGPLVMLGAAAILGGGAYMLSSHLNPKPKKKDDA